MRLLSISYLILSHQHMIFYVTCYITYYTTAIYTFTCILCVKLHFKLRVTLLFVRIIRGDEQQPSPLIPFLYYSSYHINLSLVIVHRVSGAPKGTHPIKQKQDEQHRGRREQRLEREGRFRSGRADSPKTSSQYTKSQTGGLFKKAPTATLRCTAREIISKSREVATVEQVGLHSERTRERIFIAIDDVHDKRIFKTPIPIENFPSHSANTLSLAEFQKAICHRYYQIHAFKSFLKYSPQTNK